MIKYKTIKVKSLVGIIKKMESEKADLIADVGYSKYISKYDSRTLKEVLKRIKLYGSI